MKDNKVLLGFLGGVAAGALLGILYAPDKGSKTRTKSSKRANQYADEANIKQKIC
jgi:gas vesicle protein